MSQKYKVGDVVLLKTNVMLNWRILGKVGIITDISQDKYICTILIAGQERPWTIYNCDQYINKKL